MKINYILLISLSLLFSCNNQEDDLPIIPSQNSASIEITVYKCLSAACTEKEMILGAGVAAYISTEDQEYNDDPIYNSTTDVEGKVRINQINDPCLFLTIQFDQEVQKIKENTPAGTHSFVEVYF